MRRIEMIPTAQPKLDTSPNNVDISNVQLAQETTSSARLLKFDVQEEFTKYQQKLKQDEQNKVYKYNLDKEFHIIIEEQPTKMNVKRANSFVSIATFTANKKGNMGIKPERNFESPLATKTGKSPNTNTNRRAQSHKNVFQLSGARSAQMKVRQNSDFNILQTLAVRGLPTQSFNQASNPSQVPQYIDDVQDHFSIKNMHQTADTKPQFQDGFILTQGTPGLNITNPISLDTFGRNLILPQPQKSGSNSITMYELTKSIESPNRIRTLDSRGDNDLQTTLKRLNQSPGLVNQVQQVPSSNFMKLQQTAVEAAAHQLQQQRLMDLQLYGHNNLDEIEQRIIDEGLQASNAAIGKVLSDEGLGITASAGATSPVEFIDSGRTRNEKNTLEAHSDKDIEEEHESQSPQKLEMARYNQSNHPVQVQDQNQTSNTHMDLSNQKSKTLKYLQLDNSRSPQSSKSPGDSVGVSQAMSPSPMGVSVYPDKDPHIKGIRRPISPKEYSGIAPREESIGDSTPINKKPSFIDRNPYLASSMGVQINQPVVPTLPRLTESQSPQNIQQLLTNNQGHIQSLEQLILISQGQDAHNTNSQFSQDLQFYDSNQNLRAMLNSGQGHVIVRSNTAARIEDQLPYDPMASIRNDPSVRISTQCPEGRITSKMKTKVSQRIFTRAVSDSRLGVSLNRMNSSRVKDEVSVAEMSAQVMMDQNEGITETSQQLNGSYGGTGFVQLLQEYHQQSRQTPNVISIGNIQKRTTSNEIDQSYPQISESQFRNVDLEKIFKEAIKYHEKRMKRSISKNTKKSLFTYFRQNAQEILLQDIDHFTQNQTKYHQKVLNENPRTQTDKNYRAFRRQDDIDIHLRHLNNDKASFQQQQDFAVRGKKLHSIKQVAIQQQLYAHMAQQIQLLQEIEFMNSNKGSVVKVNINAPNLVENFTKHLLPTISSRKNVNSNSNVQSTRRGAQRQQVQQVFSSIGHSGLNVIGGPRQMGSPLARGGESLQVNGQQQTSLVYNQHNEIQSNVAVMQAQVAKNMLSARSLYFKEVYSRDSSLAPNSPGLRGVNLNEQLSSKSGKIDPNNQNKQSSVVSHSGYGGAGMAEGIKSPRMQHLKGSMAASGYTTGLKFDVKEVQQQSEEKNSKQSVINILDQSREEKDDIMIEKSKSNNQLIDSSKFADSIHNQISEKQVNPVHDVFVVLTQRDNKSPRNNSISHQKHKLNLPIHMVRSSQFDEGSKASAGHHSQSVRETRKIVQNKEKSQTIQPVNMSHPEAIKSRGGNSQESLKKMTIYESENQISNYHITRPVMGDEIMKVSQVPIAGTLHANSIEAASIKKTILTQGGGRNTSIPFGRKNLSGNLETSNEKLWHRKQESNETLEINGLIQPKSVRAKIDLKEAQDNFYQQLEKDNSVIRSKSKLMNNIGKSFQGLKFNKTAEMISQIIRKDKGMPDYQEQPKQNNKNMVHNIERGGSHNKSVKVQYSRTKSDIPVQIDQTPDSSKQTFIDQNRKQIRLESMTNNLNTLTRLRDRSPTPEPLESIIQRGGEVFLKQKLHQDDSALYQPSGINSEKQRSAVQSRVTIPPEAPQEDMTSEQFQIQSENFEIEEMKSAAKNSIFGETGFFSGPQRLNQTLVGKNSKNHVPQNIEKLSMKTQGQVQYIIKNPTSHEISSSRLIENQKVLMSRPQRLHSAIHQGNLRRSFGYDQSILPGKERAGLIVQDNNIVLRVGEVSSYSTAGGIGTAKHISKMQMKNNNRLTSAGKFSQTHASTAIRESQFPKYQQSQALMHVQDQSEFDYIENSINNMQGARMRPRTAKVGGFVNNLRQQSGIGDMAQASGNINQVKPNRIESAHPAPIVQPQLKQDEAASSSFQILQSYNNRMLANDPSSLPFTNTFGVFSKASGGLSTSSINRISRPDLMKLHSRINSNQDLQLIQTNDEEWQQQYTSHLIKKKQEVALEMFQIPPQQQQQNRVVLQQQQQKKKKQPQGHINKIVNRKIKRGTVFKDENFEAKRRDGKNGVIVQ